MVDRDQGPWYAESVTSLTYREEIKRTMQHVSRAATYCERARARGEDERDPVRYAARLDYLARWLSEGVRLGVPLRSLATASRTFHPETVRRIVARYREGPPRF